MVSSETRPNACPPVIEYSLEEQNRAAGELASLPDGTILEGWLADYAVLRDQVRACGSPQARIIFATPLRES